MRSVFVFPRCSRGDVEAQLEVLGQRRDLPAVGTEWVVGGALYIVVRTEAQGLYLDWEDDDVEAISSSMGGRPSWALVVDVSGRIPGHEEVRHFLAAVIGTGGFAVDDYSNHTWTSAEIAANTAIGDGRRFFRPE
jgi:hypothetical protein